MAVAESLTVEDAEREARSRIEQDPSDTEAWLDLATAFYKSRRKNEACAAFERALELDPTSHKAMMGLAHQYRALSRVDEAITLVRRAIELKPKYITARIELVALLSRAGQHKEAVQAGHEAVAMAPDGKTYKSLAQAFTKCQRYDEAVQALTRALEIDPDDADAKRELISLKRLSALSGAPARIRPAVWPSKTDRFADVEKLVRSYVLGDFKPEAPIVDKTTRVSALGSCFAGHVAQRLENRNVPVFYKPIGEDINNTYANRHLVDWISNGPTTPWTEELEKIYGAGERSEFLDRFSNTDVFIFTLGVAPAWFSRETGAFVLAHGGSSEDKLLPKTCVFRTTTVQENAENLRAIKAALRKLSPDARFVITVSPVPLLGTYERGSAVVADTLSKATLRLALEEVLQDDDPKTHYWPSFEIVRWLGAHLTSDHPPVFGADDGYSRHVSVWLVDLIMKLFIEYFGAEEIQRSDQAGAR